MNRSDKEKTKDGSSRPKSSGIRKLADKLDPEVYVRYAKRRDELSLKDAEVSRKSGVPPYDFSKWKKGEYTPGATKLLSICEVLGITMKWLLTGQGPELDLLNYSGYEAGESGYGMNILREDGVYSAADPDSSSPEQYFLSDDLSSAISEDTSSLETLKALKRLSPAKRNLVNSLIAFCEEISAASR